jgi:nicotinate (nicotinamide) nucleotide adenylyltransferase
MLKLAIADEPSWEVCRLEIDRGGLSYTVDTLRQIHIERPDDSLFFLMGADAVRDVPRWKEPTEIFRLATPLVVCRAGEAEPDLTALAKLCVTDRNESRCRQWTQVARKFAGGRRRASRSTRWCPPASLDSFPNTACIID